MSVETVRGRVDEALADELVRFWTGLGALQERSARLRVPEVVCVRRDGAGALTGVSSVYETTVDLVGGLPVFVFRSLTTEGGNAARRELLAATYAALDAEFVAADYHGPRGLLVAESDAEAALAPELAWDEPPMLYVGRLPDGRVVRAGWFTYARVSEGITDEVAERPVTVDERFRVLRFDEQDVVSAQDVIDLWLREGVLEEHEALERARELSLVAVDEHDAPVAAMTSYLRFNAQLQLPLWFTRVFVSPAAARSDLGVRLVIEGRELHAARFASGADTRAPGLGMEVQNVGLMQRFDYLGWIWVGFTFVGVNDAGDHVRVHFFPGGRVPQGSA